MLKIAVDDGTWTPQWEFKPVYDFSSVDNFTEYCKLVPKNGCYDHKDHGDHTENPFNTKD